MKKFATVLWQTLVIGLLCASMVTMTACTTDEVLTSIDAALQTAQSLSAAVGAVSPADAAALELLTGVGITGVQAIQTAYDAYKKNKTASSLQNIVAAAQAIQANLPEELSALHIVDAKATAKATAWVNLIVSVAQSIASEVSALQPKALMAAGLPIVSGAQIQARWSMEVCQGDTKCSGMVQVHKKHTPHKFL